MRTNVLFVAMLLALAPLPSVAQDYDVGLVAYESGDYATALRELKPLAEQGHAGSQYILGLMYAGYGGGRGVLEDRAEAVRWFRSAAEQGNADAQTELGAMHATGTGVLQDYMLAHMWLNIGGANGSSLAPGVRDIVEEKMTPTDVSEAQRRARVCMGSDYTDCD